jgi:membrane-bound lytic murein transglycosylase D
MKPIIRTLALYIVFIAGIVCAQRSDSTMFPEPAILKDNVAFWKKVYTEFSLKQGVLHDREYPLLIYRTFTLNPSNRKSSSRYIESQKEQVVSCLRNLQMQPESTWTQEEKNIARMFKEHAPENALTGAQERIRFQLGQKERFRQGLERSTAYLDTIRSVFAQYDVPPRLAYLPHVESSFNYEAYSKVGAAGLWQFMRGTGKLFLKINYLIDERRDPVLATVAAARLLRQNFNELSAWPLAITAYNHGLGGMKRAVEVTGSRDISVIVQNYTSPSFQFASKNFYACFLAASEIANNPTLYFSDLHCMSKHEYKTVTLPSFMKPSVVSRYLNVPEKALMEYNPSIRAVVFSQQKQIPAGFCMRVPTEIMVPQAEKVLAAIPDSLKSEQPERSNYYNVQEGDNLAGIALRLGVPVSQLVVENNINRKNMIFTGQVLRVPSTGAAPPVTVASVNQAEPPSAQPPPAVPPPPTPQFAQASQPVSPPALAATQAPSPETVQPAVLGPAAAGSAELQGPVPPPALEPPPPTPEAPLARIVKAKAPPPRPLAPPEILADSLKEISMKKADTLPLVSQGTRSLVVPAFDVSVYNLEVTLSPAGATAKIKVSVDETIGHYADWLGVPTYRVRELNRLSGRSDIRINGSVSVPADQDKLARFVKARLEYHMALEEDFYSRYKVTDVRPHAIKRGEVLWSICNSEEQIPLWLFAKYNKHLDLGTLMPGTRVWIPVVEEKSEQDIALDSGQPITIYQLFYEPAGAGMQMPVRRMP